MANPQPTDSHLRISHEIITEIMRRNFTKQQRNILDLVLRLSWGCGKHSAYIPRKNRFELCGVSEKVVGKELKHLREMRVLIFEDGADFYQIQKDYEVWQVTPVKGWDEKKYKDLVALNIQIKSPNLRGDTPKNGGTSSDSGNSPEKKPRGFPRKSGDENGESPSVAGLGRVRITKRPLYLPPLQQLPPQPAHEDIDPFEKFQQEFGRPLSPMEYEKILRWLDEDKHSPDLIIRALEEAVLSQSVNFKYIDSILLAWEKKGWLTVDHVNAGKKAADQRKPSDNRSPQPNLSVVPGGGAGSKGQRDRDRLEAARRRAMAGGQ